MSLFVINRYEGDNQVETKNEKKHLSELLKRIEERKRERATKRESTVLQTDSENVEEPVCKKKKKKKKDKSNESNVVESVVGDSTEEKSNNADETVSADVTVSENLQKLHKKRKKTKKQTEESINVESEISSNKERHLESVNENNEQNHLDEVVGGDNVEKKKQQDDFTILGPKTKKQKREVKRVLPDWLACPEIISADLNSGPSLEKLNSVLDSKLIEILKSNHISKLFPVQDRLLSWLLKCNEDRKRGWWVRDTCVSAPTGSGKTLAYVLPVVQELQSRLVPKIRCLVVVPVQELAAQVHKVMTTYTSSTSLIVGLLSGGYSFEQEQHNIIKKDDRGQYVSKVDIIVATPGRLVDHILKTPGFSLNDLRFLVIDEADRAADWLQYLPEPHYRAPQLTVTNIRNSMIPAQKLLFSATLSQDPEKLNRLGLFRPILFTSVVVSGKDEDVNLDKEVGDFVGRYTSPEELKELAVECAAEYKPVALYQILNKSDEISKTLVFTNSGNAAHRLALLLRSFLSEKNISVGELSAQLTPKQRYKVLDEFAEGKKQILVSSDALARGLDIPNVEVVISYDLPKYIKGYIHRSGRTGRAGKFGTAVCILTPNQVGMFRHMLNNAHKPVPVIEKLELDSVVEAINYESHIENLKKHLEKEKQSELKRTKAERRVRIKPSK